jgi:hypothetical protein
LEISLGMSRVPSKFGPHLNPVFFHRWKRRLMNLGLRFLLLAIFVLLLVVPSATADPISIGGPWLEFAYADSGTPAFACDGACIPSSGGDSIEAGDPA